jgi:diacylglycerol kinase family enzyme
VAKEPILLVGNPTAQSGKNKERIDAAAAFFQERGERVELFSTLPAGATVDALTARLDASAHEVVVAMGGDGTFREVGAGILASKRREQIALGMLPTGTANDQGRSFGLDASPAALARNVAVVAARKETRIDAGHLTTFDAKGAVLSRGVFFDSAGFGLGARVLAVRNEDRKLVEQLGPIKELYRDQLVYAGALLRTFMESYVVNDKFDARGTVDGNEVAFTGLIDLIFKNTRVYGGAWVFDAESQPDDGLFEVIPFVGKRDWTSKAIVDLAGNPVDEKLLNTVGIEHSKHVRGAHVVLQFDEPPDVPLHAQIDGEEHPAGARVELRVERRALRLIVP